MPRMCDVAVVEGGLRYEIVGAADGEGRLGGSVRAVEGDGEE